MSVILALALTAAACSPSPSDSITAPASSAEAATTDSTSADASTPEATTAPSTDSTTADSSTSDASTTELNSTASSSTAESTTSPTEAPTTTEFIPTFRENRLSGIDADLEGALLGVSTGLSRAERAPRFNQLEADANRQLDIGHVFHSWDTAIPTEDDLFHLAAGRILMISWNGTDTIEIQNGVHDAWITQQATSVRDLGEPVMLRWFWEMDGRRRTEIVHSPQDFVSAWLHVRSIFDEVGATNAEFVWCPNEFLFWEGGDPDPWYPGDDHVDWLCADGYNWADTTTSPEWITFDRIFGDFVEWAAPRGKPIVIGETGSNEGEAGAKAEWLRSLPGILENDLPEIDAVVYFDKDFREFGHADWRVDTTLQTYDAWIDFARSDYLNP